MKLLILLLLFVMCKCQLDIYMFQYSKIYQFDYSSKKIIYNHILQPFTTKKQFIHFSKKLLKFLVKLNKYTSKYPLCDIYSYKKFKYSIHDNIPKLEYYGYV